MIQRLNELISYAAGGNKSRFAATMGWKPQYLHRILTGETGLGIQPVKRILQVFPELSARWLLLGTGGMLETPPSKDAADNLVRLLEIEKYIPVMSGDEIRQLAAGRTRWDEETRAAWAAELERRKDGLGLGTIKDAMKRQGLCKTEEAGK